MTKYIHGICVAALLAGGSLLSTGCLSVHSDKEDVYYDYDYYPDWDVYYDTDEHLYYWREDGHWVSGPELPPRYDIHAHHYKHLRVHRRHPWEDHPVDHPAEHLTDP